MFLCTLFFLFENFMQRKLYYYHGGKHHGAAYPFVRRGHIVQQCHSRDDGKNGFQTHQQGSDRGRHVFLRDDLQGVADGAGG